MDVWAFSAYALIVCRLLLTSVGQMNETDYWSKVTVTIYLQIRLVLAWQVQVAVHKAVPCISGRQYRWRYTRVCLAAQAGSRQPLVTECRVYYPVLFGSMVYKVTLGQVFLRIFRFFLSVSFYQHPHFWARFAKLRKATINFVMSVRVRMESNAWLPLDGFSWNLIFQYSKICRENSSFVTIGQEWQIFYMKTDICTFMIISRSVLLRMRTVSDKRWRENQNTNLSSKTCFRKSRRLWGNVEEYFRSWRPQMTIRRMRTACWITKATNTHSKCVTILFFHSNNSCTKAPQCYFTCALPVLFSLITGSI